jgi:hypothetical protein
VAVSWAVILVAATACSLQSIRNFDELAALVVALAVQLLTAGAVATGGAYHASKFPDLYIEGGGFTARYWHFGTRVSWDEIDRIVTANAPPKVRAIVLKRPGLFLNRLHANRILGISNQPAILLSDESEGLDELDSVLMEHTGAKVLGRKSP